MTAAKHVLRYLRGTSTLGLVFSKVAERHSFEGVPTPEVFAPEMHNSLCGFVDANWAPTTETQRKSTTGFIFRLNGGAVAWSSKLQTVVALSSTEAEYIALSEASRLAVFLKNVLVELQTQQPSVPIHLFEDNQSAIHISNNPENTSRVRHLDIRYHFVRQCIEDGKIKLHYIPTQCQLADSFTKSLHRILFERFRNIYLGHS